MRWKATSGLVRIGEAAVDLLLEAAANDQPLVRRHALLCLGRIGGPRTKHTLLAGLEDDDTKVRRQALKSLVGMVLPYDVACLEQAMHDEGWQNALLAAEVVWCVGPEGEHRLRQMALQECSLPAAYVIAAHGDARGRDILAEALPAGDENGNDAVEYLRALRDERCVPFLAVQLESAGGQQGRSIAEALGKIGGQAVREVLARALFHKDALVRRGAIVSLSRQSDPTLVEPLTASFCRESNKKNLDLVARALEGLGDRGGESLRQALQQGCLEGKARRSLAKRVLWRLGMEADV
jgi:HEAT repeat protein